MKKNVFFRFICCIVLCACTVLSCACKKIPEGTPEESPSDNTNPNETTLNLPEQDVTTPNDDGNGTTPEVTTDPSDDNPPPSTLQKLEGTIYYSSGFSEGKALVGILENTGSLYCINKAGEIVCEFKNIYWNDMLNTQKPMFYHGLIYLSQSLYYGVLGTETGRIITPEEMNVSAFNPVALKSGYIIADIFDENSTVVKRGIMNTSFGWVVEPNETLATLYLNNNYEFCYGEFVYSRIDRKVLNLSNGEIFDFDILPSVAWRFSVNFDKNNAADIICYSDMSQTEKAFELTGIVDLFEISNFSYDKAAIYYYNATTGKYSFNMIDTNGNILFAPIELGTEFEEVVWADTCIVYQHRTDYNEPDKFYSYDFSGKLIGTLEMFGLTEAKNEMKIVSVNDGSIVVCVEASLGYGATSNRVYLYDRDFQLLFQEERS